MVHGGLLPNAAAAAAAQIYIAALLPDFLCESETLIYGLEKYQRKPFLFMKFS